MASNELCYPGPHCKEANISIEGLMEGDLTKLSRCNFTKGILWELNQYRKLNNVHWEDFYDWILVLTEVKVLKLSTLKVNVCRLEKSCSSLKKNKQNDRLQLLLNEPALACSKEGDSSTSESLEVMQQSSPTFSSELETLKKVNVDLARELQESEAALQEEKSNTDNLVAKLSKLNIRNINKKLRRRDDKLLESQDCIDSLTDQVKVKSKEVAKLEKKFETAQRAKECYRSKANRRFKSSSESAVGDSKSSLSTLEEKYQQKFDCLESEIDRLRSDLEVLQVDYKEQQQKEKFETHIHGQLYNDNVRQCCLELLSMNVGIHQVSPIITCVLKNLTNQEIDTLPSNRTLVRMLTELKFLSYQQLADSLQQCENITLHSDGTCKFGQHYTSFQISTGTSTYSLGLSQMLSGTAKQTLELFKDILSDFEETVGSEAKCKLLSSIKNTMSDRHIVQKNFNSLLEEYRANILPEITSSWQDLTSAEQQSMSSLNNFFCGLHLLAGMADAAASTLLQWEATHFSENPTGSSVLVRKSESGIVRLVRTACKALSKHGSEQSGVYQSFTTYLSSNNLPKNPLATFKGNRFNILFYDAGAVYHISPLIEKFFTEVWQTPNQLLRAVLADIKVPEYKAGCKALGVINKIITGPLWRVLESQDISILKMNEKFCHLKSCLDSWSQDATSVMSGEAVLYSDFLPTKDQIYESLFAPSVYDATAQELLEVIFGAFSSLISRLVEDHLPNGKYDNPSAELVAETKSVPTTNVISERDFAQLDRFLREKPNATTLSLEAMIMFSNNKTASWLHTKTLKEREELMKKARSVIPEFKQLYRVRRQQLLEARASLLQAKRLQLEKLQAKKQREKEGLVQEIVKYGLWQSKQQVSEQLLKLKTKKEKVAALKLQLDFRKKVLEQKHVDKSVFFMTKNKQQLPVEVITDNLCQLLDSTVPSFPVASCSLAINCESLIGRRIFHKWKDIGGKETWYKGQVLGLVPGTNDWFNVQYDGEDEILSLNLLEDVDKGDLEIMN